MSQTKKLKFFDFASKEEIGKGMSSRTDCSTFEETLNGQVLVVCDGSQHDGGRKISQIAVDSIIKFFNYQYYSNPFVAIRNSILFASRQVYFNAHINFLLLEKGTTCSILLIRDNHVFYSQVGGSTLYLHRDGELSKLDQKRERVDEDEVPGSEKEADNPNRKKSPGKSLGRKNLLEIRVADYPFIPINGDIIISCTDGLTDVLSERQIIEVLKQHTNVNDTVDSLLQKTRYEGGEDNVTIQIIEFCNIVTVEKLKSHKPFSEALPENLVAFLSSKWTILTLIALIFSGLMLLVFENDYITRIRSYVNELIIEDENEIVDLIDKDINKFENFISNEDTAAIVKPIDVNSFQSEKKIEKAVTNKAEDKASYEKYNSITILESNSADTVTISYTIRNNETLYRISKRYNQTPEQVMRLNGMSSHDIFGGHKLKINLRAVHYFSSGETIESIADKYNIDKNVIIKANEEKEHFKEDDMILIPLPS